MNYLTTYYKNLCEQLQEELKQLNERQSLGNPTFNFNQGRNRVPPGSAGPPPGTRPPTRVDFDWGPERRTNPTPPPGFDPGHPIPKPNGPPGLPTVPVTGHNEGYPVDIYGNPLPDPTYPWLNFPFPTPWQYEPVYPDPVYPPLYPPNPNIPQ